MNKDAQILTEHLQNKEMFSFSRWGDGEWNCIMQHPKGGGNCDKHLYFPEMGKRLKDIIEGHPTYYLGEAAIARRYWKDEMEAVRVPDQKWINADCLHLSSIDNTIWPFFDALKHRDVVMVGPSRLRDHNLFLSAYIEIPQENCWLEYERIKKDITQMIFSRDVVVVYSASMMANVLIDDFSEECTNIDLGSLIDPYCGFITRSHHKKIQGL